jgi:hypothetical protein
MWYFIIAGLTAKVLENHTKEFGYDLKASYFQNLCSPMSKIIKYIFLKGNSYVLKQNEFEGRKSRRKKETMVLK